MKRLSPFGSQNIRCVRLKVNEAEREIARGHPTVTVSKAKGSASTDEAATAEFVFPLDNRTLRVMGVPRGYDIDEVAYMFRDFALDSPGVAICPVTEIYHTYLVRFQSASEAQRALCQLNATTLGPNPARLILFK